MAHSGPARQAQGKKQPTTAHRTRHSDSAPDRRWIAPLVFVAIVAVVPAVALPFLLGSDDEADSPSAAPTRA